MTIRMLFRGTVKHMLSVNEAMEGLASDAVTAVHAGDLAVTEDNRFQKLILISPTPVVEDVAAEDAVHRMALAL